MTRSRRFYGPWPQKMDLMIETSRSVSGYCRDIIRRSSFWCMQITLPSLCPLLRSATLTTTKGKLTLFTLIWERVHFHHPHDHKIQKGRSSVARKQTTCSIILLYLAHKIPLWMNLEFQYNTPDSWVFVFSFLLKAISSNLGAIHRKKPWEPKEIQLPLFFLEAQYVFL